MSEVAAATNAEPEAIATETQVAESAPAANDTGVKPEKFSERVDELTRYRREAERDRDYWRELALRNQQPQPQPKAEPPKDTTPKTLADFEYDEGKYQAYVLEQAEKRSVEAAQRLLREEQDRESRSRREASFKSRETEFAKTVQDYDSVVRNPRLSITSQMAEAIKDSDDGPALAYHLGKNPEIAEKIAQLPPIAAARELGKIEARLAHEREQAKPEKVSKAPPPPPKVEGSDAGNVSVKVDDPESDNLSDAEWTRRRNLQIEKRRK